MTKVIGHLYFGPKNGRLVAILTFFHAVLKGEWNFWALLTLMYANGAPAAKLMSNRSAY